MPADLKVLKPGKLESQLLRAEASEFFNIYAAINSTLRAWFIAAGVGGPAFILSSIPIQEKLAKQCYLQYTLVVFGIGIVAQVGIAIINKHLNWFLYRDRESSEPGKNLFLERFSEQYWIDIAADVVAGFAIIVGYFILVFRGV